ncbi:uncharacterized protein A4U43_C03F2490 [Asparagus officinalis]|uniref:Uncharacterized protein n=1 Tax=Asparagus officinalis TaxID=4686 RepID=A0A5P1F7B2_ASPOF|nr:uncharacterized protein A4U43_C03F2490 [Asparagus officinalis]
MKLTSMREHRRIVEVDSVEVSGVRKRAEASIEVDGGKHQGDDAIILHKLQSYDREAQQLELVKLAHKLPHFPGFRFIPTKNNLRRYQVNKEIKIMLKDLIQKNEQAMKPGKCNCKGLLGLMLSPTKQAQRNVKRLAMDEVIEEGKLFYFAGHQTASVLLAWTIVLLSMHPTRQTRAREEVQEICGREMPNYERIGQLKTVNMILREALRLYPPIPAQHRHLFNETTVGGFSFPGGVDPEEFKPERFSDGVLKATSKQFSFIPFGWGPKTCIGRNFALIEAKITLVMIYLSISSLNFHPPMCTLLSVLLHCNRSTVLHFSYTNCEGLIFV